VTKTRCKNASNETPWSIAFKLALFGIGCLVIGFYIQGQTSDSFSKGIASMLINMGAWTMLILIGAASFVLIVWYLWNKSRCQRQNEYP
jgi:ABC-type glucose/galactose transport system permease subunit